MINRMTDDKMSQAFDEFKGFFAFSEEQLQQGLSKFNLTKDECTHLFGGLICPKANAQALIDRMEQIQDEATLECLEKYTVDHIIEYELANHESWYTWSIDSAYDALSNFREKRPEEFSRENVLRVFREVAHKYEDM